MDVPQWGAAEKGRYQKLSFKPGTNPNKALYALYIAIKFA